MARKKKLQDALPADQAILLAAQKVFREKGFLAATIKDIALQADLTSAALYYYFDSKQEILYQFKGVSGIAPIYAAIVYGANLSQDVLDPEQRADLEQLEKTHLNNLQKILKSGKRSKVFSFTSSTMIAFAIFGACEHLSNWVKEDGKYSIEEIANQYSVIALRIADGNHYASV